MSDKTEWRELAKDLIARAEENRKKANHQEAMARKAIGAYMGTGATEECVDDEVRHIKAEGQA